jgi:hypothetical protein
MGSSSDGPEWLPPVMARSSGPSLIRWVSPDWPASIATAFGVDGAFWPRKYCRREQTVGILPKERNGVAIDVRHDKTRELGALRLVRGAALRGETVILGGSESIHRGRIAGKMKLRVS